jgi:hypothetical protein
MDFINDNFINDNIKNIIKKGIDDLYYNLNIENKQILYKYTTKLIQFLSIQYNFEGTNYEYQFIQNNYRDVKWLSTLLLPYLNTPHIQLKSFDDMYKKKYNQNCDINKEEPQYVFTNIEYNRCNRYIKNDMIITEEINFNEEHIRQNFLLLLKSLLLCSHKLYVNWINIIPYVKIMNYEQNEYKRKDDFTESILFISTQELFYKKKLKEVNLINFIDNNDQTQETKDILKSLYIGDIYNTIRVYLYEEIKNIKLLIFDLVIIEKKHYDTAITILNEYFYHNDKYLLNYALQDISWDNLDKLDQNGFINKLNNLFNVYLNDDNLIIVNPVNRNEQNGREIKENYDNNPVYTISRVSIKKLIRGLLINFDNKYKNKKIVIDSGYISLKTNMEEDDDYDEEDDGYDFSNQEETIKSIKPEFIYTFFREILQEFKTTFYSSELLNENKTEINEVRIFYEREYSLKNLYNYAKSLSHVFSGDKKKIFNKNWVSLTNSEKKIILDRLNDKVSNFMDWFNIGRYIRSLFDAGYVQEKKISIPDLNKEIYRGIRDNLIQNIFDILRLKGILSKFVINRELTDMDIIDTKGKRFTDYVAERLKSKYFKKEDDNDYYLNANYYLTDLPYKYSGRYFDEISSSGWYSMDPMQWISQLGFCHHFINNRVSYVSGATGVGKSTHVPKLFLYYLKAIDYKSCGSVVCTQPRKTPTEGNAFQVSKQMGIDIKNDRNKNDRNKNDLDKSEFSEYYYVQMQHKDKKHIKNNKHLILKFITDGTLLQQFKELPPVFKKTLKNKDKKVITNDNLYDIVIIDEAHEHNKNMDLLLTVMRLFTYHNPSIRFVILSATLDEDEPNYRRYYRVINDNLKFPYDFFIKNEKLDRINIDRRYHISPPGSGTRFVVNEYYEDNSDPDRMINLIKRLIKTQKGDILVFQPGEGDINKLLDELNKTIDSNWIALPFFSSMNDDKKEFIQEIDKAFSKLRMDRSKNFNDCPNIYDGNASYTNFVLIATNIAEASITISRLFYVIDTGTRKSNYYDYKRRNNKLLTTTISETSRVQRKGRVGRVGPGDAYFMYKKGTTTDNKTPFEISIGNVGFDIFALLQNSSSENKFDKSKYPSLKTLYETSEGEFDYIGESSQNNYDFKDYIPEYYETGYNIDDIKDDYGRFYIIHPDELFLKRNMYGRIKSIKSEDIEIKNANTGLINSKKMDSYFEDYETMNYIYKKDKTEFGINMIEMCEKLKLDSTIYARILIYGLLLSDINSERYNDLIIGISILNIINGDITKILKKDKLDVAIVNTILSNNKDSDVEVLIDKIKQVLQYLYPKSFNIVDDIMNGEIQFDKTKNIDREKLKNIYLLHVDYEDTDIDREDLINKIADNISNKLIKQKNKLKFICDKLELDYNEESTNFMKTFINTYIKLKENISHFFYTDSKDKNYVSFINKYKKIYFEKNYNHYDIIKLSFLLSQPYNIALNILQTNGYITLYSPVANSIINLGTTKTVDKNGNKQYIKSTFINDKYTRYYIYFDQFNSVTDSITIIFNININIINELKLFRNIYNKDRIREIVQKHNVKLKSFIEKLDNERKLKLKLSKDYDKIIGAQHAYNKLLIDLK